MNLQFTYDTYNTSGTLLNAVGDAGYSTGTSFNLIPQDQPHSLDYARPDIGRQQWSDDFKWLSDLRHPDFDQRPKSELPEPLYLGSLGSITEEKLEGKQNSQYGNEERHEPQHYT